jgi:hypothetical protein
MGDEGYTKSQLHWLQAAQLRAELSRYCRLPTAYIRRRGILRIVYYNTFPLAPHQPTAHPRISLGPGSSFLVPHSLRRHQRTHFPVPDPVPVPVPVPDTDTVAH